MNKEEEVELFEMIEKVNEVFKGKELRKVYSVLMTMLECMLVFEGDSEEEARKKMNEIFKIYAKNLEILK